MKIYVGCDHAGLELKLKVMAAMPHIEWQDMGTHSSESVDYPDYANKVCEQIVKAELQNKKNLKVDSKDSGSLGILICSSGQGMAIRANKYTAIRAALCWNKDTSLLAREHNNANVLCFGSKFVTPDQAVEMIETFTSTAFAGGRHQTRVDKISDHTDC